MLRGVFLPCFLIVVAVAVLAGTALGQEYYYDSHQITDQHRFADGAMGGFWGHHLGHMVRTATQGLWYVDDTGRDVNIDPNINYFRYNGTAWQLMKTLANPLTIQQNDATVAVGDTIYSYGVNITGGYIEEAVCDTRTNTASYNRRIRYIGRSTNYIGAAVSPGGTRVVWWTRVVDANGPSDWVYMYNKGSGWSPSIVSSIPANDFSYVFSSFLNDSTFYAGGEIPGGNAPNWTFGAAAGKVVLGKPIAEFSIMKGDNVSANDIWVNRANGDVHFLVYGSYGGFGYFYKPAGGAWTDTVALFDNLTSVSRCRFIDVPDGNLYLVASMAGFKMLPIPKSTITGKINFAAYSLVSLGSMQGFNASYAIWGESREFQTTPVGGLNFAYPGNDFSYSNLLRHLSVGLNPGGVALRISMPNGSETYQGKQSLPIYWYRLPSAGIDSVRIELSTDGGAAWTTVAAKAPNTGSYLWHVPTFPCTTCRMRISNAAGGSPADTSDGNFIIAYVPVILKSPVCAITRPSKDTTVVAGSTMTFEGTASDSDGYIVNYVWTTGDGRVVKGIVKKFDHIYTTPGTYIATYQVQDNDTLWSTPDSVKVKVSPGTGVRDDPALPSRLELFPNYPNPFNAGTIISYSLNGTMDVRLRIFGVTGEEIARLVEGVQQPGVHHVAWDARTTDGRIVSSGWYMCRLETASGRQTQKILLLR